jgi:hypothetical protein
LASEAILSSGAESSFPRKVDDECEAAAPLKSY